MSRKAKRVRQELTLEKKMRLIQSIAVLVSTILNWLKKSWEMNLELAKAIFFARLPIKVSGRAIEAATKQANKDIFSELSSLTYDLSGHNETAHSARHTLQRMV